MPNKQARPPRSFSFPELGRKGKNSIRSFSRKELATFLSLFFVSIVTFIWMISILNSNGSVDVPTRGGTLREGIIGTPRFVNPVLAVSDADKDISALVYSGLMRLGDNGTTETDLAESYSISPDKKTYTFILKKDIFFHDGDRVTANDVVYTINQIENPLIDSPKKSIWQGIVVNKIDDTTVSFTLKQPFSPFLELATIGIIPEHLFSELSPEEFIFSTLNINAVGSGPYKISGVNRNASGIADEFILNSFRKFNFNKPFITKISISSYSNEKELGNALTSGKIDIASGLSPERARLLADKGLEISEQKLPRVFGLFMNKNLNPIFNDSTVVSVVKNTIHKQEIIDKVLFGYGTTINGPIPSVSTQNETTPNFDTQAGILEKAGWKINGDGIRVKTDTKNKTTQSLTFSITTADTSELVATADIIKENLEAIGFSVQIKIYSLGDLNQDIIRPRDYEALLFGQFVTGNGSLYSFWHSSQTENPGLNVAMYKSNIVDKSLNELFISTEVAEKNIALGKISSDIERNAPVAFIYSPLYLEAKEKGFMERNNNNNIILPSDRFRGVYTWYLETEKVWKIFIKN